MSTIINPERIKSAQELADKFTALTGHEQADHALDALVQASGDKNMIAAQEAHDKNHDDVTLQGKFTAAVKASDKPAIINALVEHDKAHANIQKLGIKEDDIPSTLASTIESGRARRGSINMETILDKSGNEGFAAAVASKGRAL